jgi:hypothetical protein
MDRQSIAAQVAIPAPPLSAFFSVVLTPR